MFCINYKIKILENIKPKSRKQHKQLRKLRAKIDPVIRESYLREKRRTSKIARDNLAKYHVAFKLGISSKDLSNDLYKAVKIKIQLEKS